MRIAQVAPLSRPVAPQQDDPTARLIAGLVDGLVEQGHQVALFASGDSHTTARLVATLPQALSDTTPGMEVAAAHVLQLGALAEAASEFDIVHCHVECLCLPFDPLIPVPFVHTIHNLASHQWTDALLTQYAGCNYVAVSNYQRTHHPHLNWVATMYPGLPVEQVPFVSKPERYLVYAGDISPKYRPQEVIQLGKHVGMPVRLAGRLDPVHEEFFNKEVELWLEPPLIEYLGTLPWPQRLQLLGNATAAVFPAAGDSSINLTMLEAMACGTPVVTGTTGTAPEVVAHGQSGFLCSSLDEMADAVREALFLNRERCRQYVARRFPLSRMVEEHLCLYQDILRRRD